MAGEITVHQLPSHLPSLGMALLGRFCQNSNTILAKRSHFCYAHPLKIKLNEERWLSSLTSEGQGLRMVDIAAFYHLSMSSL